jgi:amidase
MKLAEYANYDAVGLADLVRRKEVSAAELANTAAEACAAVNPSLSAVCETWEPDLSRVGSAVEEEEPLAGVPFLLKDVGVTMAGKKIEFGSRLGEGLTAGADSFLMTRFRDAGLVTFGRTTTPEFAWAGTTESRFYGPTRNPWHLGHSVGGSSGGAAAAVAGGIVPIAHGTDGAGSIRIPAGYCGLFGLKPSRGRVSNSPILDDGIHGLVGQLGVSRSVRDSAALLDVIQGAALGDPYTIAPPTRSYLQETTLPIGKRRIGVVRHAAGGSRTSPAVLARLDEAIALCETLGHEVVEAELNLGMSWDAFVDFNTVLWSTSIAAGMQDIAAATGRAIDLETVEPQNLTIFQAGKGCSAIEMHRALDAKATATRSISQFFSDYDLLMSPTMPAVAVPLGQYAEGAERMSTYEWTARVFQHSPFTALANVAGIPAMSVPLYNDPKSGLPIGIQFFARHSREDQLFRLAGQLERAAPWSERVPSIWAGSKREERK